MNSIKQLKVSFLILTAIFLNGCASPKYQPKQKVEPNYATGTAYTYHTLSQAYLSRGFKLKGSKLSLNNTVKNSPLSSHESQSLLTNNMPSNIELVLALPKDADFSNLKTQKRLWAIGQYLTEKGNKQQIKFDEYKKKSCNPCIITTPESRNTEKLKINSPTLLIKI